MPDPTYEVDLDAIYTFAVQLGKDAGAMLMAGAQARMGGGGSGNGGDGGGAWEEKESAVDIVTKTDEGMLVNFLLLVEVFNGRLT